MLTRLTSLSIGEMGYGLDSFKPWDCKAELMYGSGTDFEIKMDCPYFPRYNTKTGWLKSIGKLLKTTKKPIAIKLTAKLTMNLK